MNDVIDSPEEYSPEYILSALHIESYKLSPSQYSKIGMLHNTVVGHYGLERTLKRLKDCSTERVRSTTLLRPLFFFFFFTVFLFRATIVIEGEGIGARSVRFPHRFLCLPDPLEKMMGSNSGPCVSECVHRYRWLYHSTI